MFANFKSDRPNHYRLLVYGIGRVITPTQIKTGNNHPVWAQVIKKNEIPLDIELVQALGEGLEAAGIY